MVKLATDGDRRDDQHGGAGDRRDHRRPGGERARQRRTRTAATRARASSRQPRRGPTRSPRARPTPGGPDLREHEGEAVGLPARRHGLLGRQLPTTANPAGSWCARRPSHPEGPVHAEGVPDRQGPLEQRGRRVLLLPAAAREWVTGHHVPRDRRAARAQLRDGSDDEGVRRPAEHLHPVRRPTRTAATTRSTTTACSART